MRATSSTLSRVFDHALLERMAAVNAAPVLNLLSDVHHPLQALADLLTVEQLLGRIEGAKIAFVGEAHNVARSLAEGCALLGAEFVIASPDGYGFDGADVRQVTDPAEAVAGADVVYAAGSTASLHAVAAAAEHHGAWSQTALAVDQPCGTGLCFGCVVPVVGEAGTARHARACVDGPVFRGDRVRWSELGEAR